MKVTDYIIEYLKKVGVTHLFGYPGGVICHLIDSASSAGGVELHVTYNEQGAAFAACGYAQASHKLGVAFSTSGPGATNLVTGIANAFFDSVPVLFITGQVDTYALNNKSNIRQKGFQETNVVDMVKSFTKYAVRVDKPEDIKFYLKKAVFEAFDGNPGPVLLDLPADIQRADVDIDSLKEFISDCSGKPSVDFSAAFALLKAAKRPVLLVGNGVKIADAIDTINVLTAKWNIPAVTSLPAFDVFAFDNPNYFGFIGTNGQRYANFVFGKADLVLVLGSRLDIRQIGLKRDRYLNSKHLIRIDVDQKQLDYSVLTDEINYCVNLTEFLRVANCISLDFSNWNDVCKQIKNKLLGYDDCDYNVFYSVFSKLIPCDSTITLDVGQNQIWFAQSSRLKGQRVYMSAGHGSMGYSLPAAIGVFYATGKEVFCFNGDGGIMMNIQELQFIKREKLPIKIICFNNHALGMIRGFQERNFNKKYSLTTEKSGWQSPNFEKIAEAFGFHFLKIDNITSFQSLPNLPKGPVFVEVCYEGETNLIPNFGRTDCIQNQLPEMDESLFEELMML